MSLCSSSQTARDALVQGDTAGALQEMELLLSLAGAGAQADAGMSATPACEAVTVEVAAGNFVGADTPRLIELTLHRVPAAASDPHAAAWMQCAHRALMAQADAITDSALRQMFLFDIPYHREIVALWGAQEER